MESIRIVAPEATEVLAPTEGLTLVTCHPFWWVGKAPKRLIVRARHVPDGTD